jgi:hypothetical protein
MKHLWLVALGSSFLCAQIHAQSPSSADPLDVLRIPATLTGVAQLAGIAGSVDKRNLVVEIIEKLHSSEESASLPLRSYLELSERLQAAWSALDPKDTGISLESVSAASNRRQFDALLQAMGLQRVSTSVQVRPAESATARELRRLLAAGGYDIESMAQRWNAGERARLVLPSTDVPLPLGFETWRRVLIDEPVTPSTLFRSIVANRSRSLVFYGLSSLDEETTQFVSSQPALLRSIRNEHAGAFAAFARSLHVHDGRVDVPGGRESESLWQATTGARADQPAVFIRELLGRDQGRLAYFYDTLASLDDSRLKFALGLWMAEATVRARSFAALYESFNRIASQPGSFSSIRVFERAILDPAIFLFQIAAEASGEPRQPSAASLWLAVFETEDVTRPVNPDDLRDTHPFYAAMMIERIFAPVQQHRYDRFDAVMFAQRVFRDIEAKQLTDVVMTLRGFGRYRALILSLERMGIRHPAVYAAAIRRAAALGTIRDPDRGTVAQSLFQGMLALVERARFTRLVSSEQAASLVRSAVALETNEEGQYFGAPAHWIETQFLAVVDVEPEPEAPKPLEAKLVAILAGQASARTPPVFTWVDWSYRVDSTGLLKSRIGAIRARQGGNPLDQVLSLARVARSLTATSDDVAAVKQAGVALTRLSETLSEPNWLRPRDDQGWSPRSTLRWASREIAGIRRPQDIRGRSTQIERQLSALSDVLLSFTLRSIIYATYLGDPAGPLLLGGDVAQRHDFGVKIEDLDTRLHAAWSLPDEPSGYGLNWQVWGSLLALDIGLVRLSVQQVTNRPPPRTAGFSDGTRKAMLQTLALFNSYERTDAELTEIAARMARGRQRIAALRQEPNNATVIGRELRFGARRLRGLQWVLAQEPNDLERSFTLLETFQLGTAADSAGDLDGWGASLLAWNGCLCLAMPSPQAWEDLEGRAAAGYLAARLPDLQLRIAELLHELRVPAALAHPILLGAFQDLLDEATVNRPDDHKAASRYAATYPRSRVEAAVSSLTATGLLVPVSRRQ